MEHFSSSNRGLRSRGGCAENAFSLLIAKANAAISSYYKKTKLSSVPALLFMPASRLFTRRAVWYNGA